MSFSGLNDNTVGLIEKDIAEPEHLIQCAGHRKNLWMGRYANHAAQNLWSHTVTCVSINDAIEPGATSLMIGGIGSKRVHKNVNIGKDHGVFITSSKLLEQLRSTPGRIPPVALDTGNLIRSRRLVFGLDKMRVNPSSTSDVRLRPSSAACFFARFNRSSFILMVVLMHQYITLMHQYVKLRFAPRMPFGTLIKTPARFTIRLQLSSNNQLRSNSLAPNSLPYSCPK